MRRGPTWCRAASSVLAFFEPAGAFRLTVSEQQAVRTARAGRFDGRREVPGLSLPGHAETRLLGSGRGGIGGEAAQPSEVSEQFVRRAWTVTEAEGKAQTIQMRHSFKVARLFFRPASAGPAGLSVPASSSDPTVPARHRGRQAGRPAGRQTSRRLGQADRRSGGPADRRTGGGGRAGGRAGGSPVGRAGRGVREPGPLRRRGVRPASPHGCCVPPPGRRGPVGVGGPAPELGARGGNSAVVGEWCFPGIAS